jgi:hypothetical protein
MVSSNGFDLRPNEICDAKNGGSNSMIRVAFHPSLAVKPVLIISVPFGEFAAIPELPF